MRNLSKATLLLIVLAATSAFATTITVGNHDSGNCYPFMCNDSGTNAGVSIDYQQAYAASAFSGPINITSITWEDYPAGPAYVLGGQYDFYWGYSSVGLALGSNMLANYAGGPYYLGTGFGGFTFGQFLTATVNFTYNPAMGDLILEIIASNQELIPNGSGNGYLYADYTGATTVRNYCFGSAGCSGGGATTGALVTSFNGSPVPEPGTMVMFGSGLLGLVGIARRKFNV